MNCSPEYYWRDAYVLREESVTGGCNGTLVPVFLRPVAQRLLQCGKSIEMLGDLSKLPKGL